VEVMRDTQTKRRKNLFICNLDLRKAFDTVNHKIFKLMLDKGAPREWVEQLSKMLVDRKLKLYDAMVELKVGTVQGSPISPLLFILFINPLIERLEQLGYGINITQKGKKAVMVNGTVFADDTCVVAEDIGQLQAMLDVCEAWAKDFGMSFNASKSELIQLCPATLIPNPRPIVKLGGKPIPWVKETKSLGFMLQEGRKKQLPCPLGKLWRCYHRVKRALDPHLPLPLRSQLQLIQSDILSVALYPTAVKDMDYKSLDVFIISIFLSTIDQLLIVVYVREQQSILTTYCLVDPSTG
jgi:hypothetical protein